VANTSIYNAARRGAAGVASGRAGAVGSHFLFIVLFEPYGQAPGPVIQVPRVLLPVTLRSAGILLRPPTAAQRVALGKSRGTLDRTLGEYIATFGEVTSEAALRDVMHSYLARAWRYLLATGETARPLPAMLAHRF